jgi:acyl-CoA synthetase (NDP forming)/GNAT superfamily N-acetyltransferase
LTRARFGAVPDNDRVQYPEHWEADVVLRDGGTAHIRPIHPDDGQRLVDFHGRLSEQTIYFRFFAPHPRLSEREIRYFTHVDYTDRVALVALVGDELLGIVRYDRVGAAAYGLPGGTGPAEVAFVIRDDQQGRGIASVLLEHLAAAATERGVDRFVADTLPENRRMIAIFQEAGYEVARGFEDGVVRLTLDLTPTALSLAVMEAREHRSEARSIAALLHPKSVAVVGASRDPAAVGHGLLRHVLEGGFAGRVYVVNRAASEIAGVPSYPSVLDVPEPVEVAVVAVPAPSVLDVVRDCAAKGVRGLVVVSAGFADAGPEGRERQRALVRAARGNGMRVIGPNCFGLVNADPAVSLNASLSPAMPPPGRVGFFSQSGAIGVALIEAAAGRGVGVSTFVSAGNRADVSGNDLLQYWEDDDDTGVVALYLESFGNPRKFSRLARRVARVKPVVCVMSGRFAQLVPPGHALEATALPSHAIDALLAQAGVVQVDSVPELLDVAQAFAGTSLPAGDRVAIVGNSDSLGYVALDVALRHGLRARDPVDLGNAATPDQLRATVAKVVADDEVDGVVVALLPPVSGSADDLVAALIDGAGARKPVLVALVGFPAVPDVLRGGGGPAWFGGPAEAMRALASAVRYAAWRSIEPGLVPELPDVRTGPARQLVRDLLAGAPEGRELAADEFGELLGHYGIEVWPGRRVTSVEESVAVAEEFGYPVVLKTMAPGLRDRLDLGGVRLGIEDSDELARAFSELAARFGAAAAGELLVQPMAGSGVSTVVRAIEDPSFGAVVSFALGGVASALLDDVAYELAPLTDRAAAALIRSVRAAPLLFGYQGTDPVDVSALEGLLLRVGRLADDLPEVAELALQPVLVGVGGLTVLHAVARIGPPPAPGDSGPRRLRVPS